MAIFGPPVRDVPFGGIEAVKDTKSENQVVSGDDPRLGCLLMIPFVSDFASKVADILSSLSV